MRRVVPAVLVGLGVFLLVAAALLKFYAYPKLAVAPIDQNSETTLTAEGAVIFDTDPSMLTEVMVDLEAVSTTRGDVDASQEASDDLGEEIRVWTDTQTITSDDGVIRSQSRGRAAFDAHTGEAVDCCGAFSETTEDERVSVVREGLIYKFPFDTKKETYEWWDGTAATTVPAEFVEETDVDGLAVYKFEADLPPAVVGTREVPASVVGERGSDNIEADVVYANKRTFYVEPVTGAVIDRVEEQRSTLAIDGEERATTTEADLSFTDAQVAENVDEYESKASLLSMVNGLFPILGLVLGLILIAVGLLLSRRGGDAAPAGAGAKGDDTRRATAKV
ncbi:DUF3068 domain-containing protein [Nocardioides sp. dk4132]|uniref:DUF3068 domain-containing protein n=1 Tax=unclassified Nocardioides TaxID=2615069 RepID=UPI0012980753|nr:MULTISPECIES: DUF3068 domain-containing protein [unclassified Nocardioides]MQW76404.1 DUF3068 domain-containing protein [Nocardioides sp. dk4132]QGA07322.1 DUF3068 domain-containing protein [Nocardioides sp. dk884]